MNENEQRKEKSILKLYFAKIVVNDRYIWKKNGHIMEIFFYLLNIQASIAE